MPRSASSAPYNQASQYIEGTYVYNNTEGYIQDNWKVTSKLTLDYGVRFVHQQPQYDKLGRRRTSCPTSGRSSQAPALYRRRLRERRDARARARTARR